MLDQKGKIKAFHFQSGWPLVVNQWKYSLQTVKSQGKFHSILRLNS